MMNSFTGPLGVSANCAYIDTNDKVVREADCVASKKKGYICKLKGNQFYSNYFKPQY